MARMSDLPVLPLPIRRRWLRQPSRVADRAESDWDRVNMVADGLQPLQNGLPLFPIQLPQEWPQSLDERIFEQRFAVRFGDEEAVQSHIQSLRNLFARTETGRH